MIDYEFIPATTLEEGVRNLYEIVNMLRSPEGCPWDRKQTTRSVTANLLDETYEYLDGVIRDDDESQREEIGDVMINVFMNLSLSEEEKRFTPVEALNEVCSKLLRRHPHVFGKLDTHGNAEEAKRVWDDVKKNTEGRKTTADTFFSNIPLDLPPLMKAYEIQKKLEKAGFDWDKVDGMLNKVDEELSEVKEAVSSGRRDDIELEIGDLLFSVVNVARFFEIRPNIALHRTNEKIIGRFTKLFRLAEKRNISLDKEHAKEMNALWNEIKSCEEEGDY